MKRRKTSFLARFPGVDCFPAEPFATAMAFRIGAPIALIAPLAVAIRADKEEDSAGVAGGAKPAFLAATN